MTSVHRNVGSTGNAAARNSDRLGRIRRWSHLLDSAFRVPGTSIRFGWDAIVGLIPGIGDSITALFSLFILVHAFRIRVPGIVRARMFINVGVDLLIGAIPFLGDIFDVAWKSNTRNLELLERHASGVAESTAADWVMVLGSVGVVLLVLVIPILLLAALIGLISSGWGSPPAWRLLLAVVAG
jgi:hypothetical protein